MRKTPIIDPVPFFSPRGGDKRTTRRRTNNMAWHIKFVGFGLHDIDKDGVPNWRDCRPFNPRFHSNEDFEKAKKHFGLTRDVHKTAWILPSGEMLNFSPENISRLYKEIGRQNVTSDNQIAHWEIGKVLGISGRAANRIFEDKGAIRFRKTPGRGMYAQMVHEPTKEQAMVLTKALRTPPQPTFLVIERVPPTIKGPMSQKETDYMELSSPHPSIIQKFISQAFR